MEFKLNGKKVKPKVTVGLAFALTEKESLPQNEMIALMLKHTIGMEKKQIDALPLECMDELTAIIEYVGSKLEQK